MRGYRYILVLVDVFLMLAAFLVALILRFDQSIPAVYLSDYVKMIPWMVGVSALTFIAIDLYNRMWEYASVAELIAIIKAVTLTVMVISIAAYSLNMELLPWSVYVIAWLLGIFSIGASRLWWRMTREYLIHRTSRKRVAIVGINEDAILAARMVKRDLVGFLDDNKQNRRTSIMGFPVLGPTSHLAQLIKSFDIDELIVAKPAEASELSYIIHICKDLKVVAKIIEQGNGGMMPKLRQVNLEDLLGRASAKLDMDRIAGYMLNRSVMVTGAGGSIGSELCRQIAGYKPRKLITVDFSENNLFDLENGLRSHFPELLLESVLLDVKDQKRLDEFMQNHRPEVVFHAAAYKHVPMMERFPMEAWNNNVIGTKNLLDAAHRVGVETFVLISTDKAVRPANAMGASKRLGEIMVQQANHVNSGKYSAVRFGNVLGSRGSVIPIFQKQIEEGGPITVTDPEMTRYFMTIPEAVKLVIQAGAMAQGGEVFVLDMGNPVNILELAENLVRLSGLTPGVDIEIKITGSRPGEKKDEELFTRDEELGHTVHGRIFVAGNGHLDVQEIESLMQSFFQGKKVGSILDLKVLAEDISS